LPQEDSSALLHVEFEHHKATVTSVDMNWCCLPRRGAKKEENPYSSIIGGKQNVFACFTICCVGMLMLAANYHAFSQHVSVFNQFCFQHFSLSMP